MAVLNVRVFITPTCQCLLRLKNFVVKKKEEDPAERLLRSDSICTAEDRCLGIAVLFLHQFSLSGWFVLELVKNKVEVKFVWQISYPPCKWCELGLLLHAKNVIPV